MSRKKSKSGSVITIIAVVLLLVLLIGLISVAFNTDGFKQFEYFTKDGVKVGERTTLSLEEPTTFELEYISTSDKTNGNITVKVYANTDTNFSFKTESGNYVYNKVGELTDCFDIETEAERFTISVREGFTAMTDILSVKYGTVEPLADWKNDEYFRMEIKTDSQTHNIYFTIDGLSFGHISVSIDQSEIIF